MCGLSPCSKWFTGQVTAEQLCLGGQTAASECGAFLLNFLSGPGVRGSAGVGAQRGIRAQGSHPRSWIRVMVSLWSPAQGSAWNQSSVYDQGSVWDQGSAKVRVQLGMRAQPRIKAQPGIRILPKVQAQRGIRTQSRIQA